MANGIIKRSDTLGKLRKSENDNKELRKKLVRLVRAYRGCTEETLRLEKLQPTNTITVGSIQNTVENKDDFDINDYEEFEDDE